MKFSPHYIAGAAALLFSGVHARFDLAGMALKAVPSCAQSCFLAGASQIGCGTADYACQCHQEAALYAVVEECVATMCEASMYQNVIDGRSLVCKRALAEAYGGTVTVSGSLTVIPGTIGSGTVVPMSTSTMTTGTTGTGFGTTSTSFSGAVSATSSAASTTTAGGAGGGGSSATTSAPSYYASSSVISGSERRGPPRSWLLMAVTGLGAIFFCI